MDVISIVIITIVSILMLPAVYVMFVKDRLEYRKAKKDIFEFVKSYKKRCTGSNRFVVSIETLQDSFREYETKIIHRVWLELIHERIIEIDPQDGVWCIR